LTFSPLSAATSTGSMLPTMDGWMDVDGPRLATATTGTGLVHLVRRTVPFVRNTVTRVRFPQYTVHTSTYCTLSCIYTHISCGGGGYCMCLVFISFICKIYISMFIYSPAFLGSLSDATVPSYSTLPHHHTSTSRDKISLHIPT